MANVIEMKDLDKHLPAIVFSENLKDLTAEQIETVAILMEKACRKGKEEGEAKQPVSINLQPQISINSAGDLADVHNVVRQALDKQWQLLAKTYGVQTTR